MNDYAKEALEDSMSEYREEYDEYLKACEDEHLGTSEIMTMSEFVSELEEQYETVKGDWNSYAQSVSF